MEVIREHWISLDKCPSCNSKKNIPLGVDEKGRITKNFNCKFIQS